YQVSRAVFFRVVGECDATKQDALRHETRSFAPILLKQPDGTFVPAAANAHNQLRVDWLFSYQPNPGTVFFAGYGSTLTEPDAFKFRDIHRTTDGFFVKLSYLWRMKLRVSGFRGQGLGVAAR